MLSRVADSLYWMSRYLERAEHTARLLDLNLVLMLDQTPANGMARWERLLLGLGMAGDTFEVPDAYTLTQALAFDRSNQSSIIGALGVARDNARQVREQVSSEMWEQLNRLYLQEGRMQMNDIQLGEFHPFFHSIKEGIHLFHGITEATMPQSEGYHWMQLGRFIERATNTCSLIDAYFTPYLAQAEEPEAVGQYLDWVGLLKGCTAFEAYCQVYTADLQPPRIAEFLLLNNQFPRSVRFAAATVQRALQAIVQLTGGRGAAQAEQLAGRLRSSLDYITIGEIIGDDMPAYLKAKRQLCTQLHAAIQRIYFAPPLEAVLAS